MEIAPVPLPFEAPEHVLRALTDLGRTEDVSLSPNHGRLAIPGFHRDSLLLVDIDKGERQASGTLRLSGCTEIFSPYMHGPHGVSFLDEYTLAVANRHGVVLIYRLPPAGYEQTQLAMVPARVLLGSRRAHISTPGSLTAVSAGRNRWDILVCNNYSDTVTRHRVEGPNLRPRSDHTLLSDGLSIPDGIAVIGDGRWIAVSNHNHRSVYLYENMRGLNRHSRPNGTLTGVEFPHGLRASRDGRRLFVASAASPFIHVYAAGEDGWRGEHDPVLSLRVMDDETFMRGRHNLEEGGPKGVDLSEDLNFLVTTSDYQRIAFFDLAHVLDAGTQTPA